MSDNTMVAVVVALIGVGGGAVGAWLNARLSTRRDRWALKRQLYTNLLQALWEVKSSVALMGVIPRTDVDARFMKALDGLVGARAIAALLLTDDTLEALDALAQALKAQYHSDGDFDAMRARFMSTFSQVHDAVVRAARDDLKL